jgi:uncharacterized protein with HEPN domain
MKHPERVEDYLEHIAEAIDRATSYLQAMPHFETFQQNLQVQDAVVRNIEIIGEAVNKIYTQTRNIDRCQRRRTPPSRRCSGK